MNDTEPEKQTYSAIILDQSRAYVDTVRVVAESYEDAVSLLRKGGFLENDHTYKFTEVKEHKSWKI